MDIDYHQVCAHTGTTAKWCAYQMQQIHICVLSPRHSFNPATQRLASKHGKLQNAFARNSNLPTD
jgi:hypothetical protein